MAILTLNQVCNICCIHYSAGLRCCALGAAVEGGRLFAKQGGLAWIVALSAQQVARVWASQGDAVTVAQAANACGDWFVPSRIDLNLGHDCKAFWDSFSSTCYWSSTDFDASLAWSVNFANGGIYGNVKTSTYCVRAFRRVSY